jgi:hypothetical protein
VESDIKLGCFLLGDPPVGVCSHLVHDRLHLREECGVPELGRTLYG